MGRFYVYAVMVGETVAYVGKGVGRRGKISAAKHGGQAKILERFDSEDDAFAAECRWIADLAPTENKLRGGNGGRSTATSIVPLNFREHVTEREMRQGLAHFRRISQEMERVGPRRYVARALLTDFAEIIPPSKVEAIRQVAHGDWA